MDLVDLQKFQFACGQFFPGQRHHCLHANTKVRYEILSILMMLKFCELDKILIIITANSRDYMNNL